VAQRNDRPAAFMLRTEFGLQVRLPQSYLVSPIYEIAVYECNAGVTHLYDFLAK
jgi:hypothetical protein